MHAPQVFRRAVALGLALALAVVAAESAAPARVVAAWRFAPRWFGRGLSGGARAHGATLVGQAPSTAFQKGVDGQALAFDRGRYWVRVPHHDDLSLTDDFTVEAVIRPTTVEGFNTIAWKGDRSCRPERINYTVDIRDGRLELKSKDAAGLWLVFATVDKVVEPDRWCRFCMSFQRGLVEMTVDGAPVAVRFSRDDQSATPPQSFLPNSADLVIGNGAAGGNLPAYPFTGQVQELRLYRGRYRPADAEAMAWLEARTAAAMRELAAGGAAAAARVSRLRAAAAVGGDSLTARRELAALAETAAAEARQEAAAGAAAERAAASQNRYRARFAGSDRPFLLAPLSTTRRAARSPTLLADLTFADSFRLSAARGETEGFQILLTGHPDRVASGVAITVSEFQQSDGQGRLAATAISFGAIASVTSEKPDIPMPFSGAIDDPILDGVHTVDVPQAGFTPVYFRIRVPETTAPGRYAGTVLFTAGATAVPFRVELQVYDFALPPANSIPLVFCFFKDFYKA